jgi:hypothetical protein
VAFTAVERDPPGLFRFARCVRHPAPSRLPHELAQANGQRMVLRAVPYDREAHGDPPCNQTRKPARPVNRATGDARSPPRPRCWDAAAVELGRDGAQGRGGITGPDLGDDRLQVGGAKSTVSFLPATWTQPCRCSAERNPPLSTSSDTGAGQTTGRQDCSYSHRRIILSGRATNTLVRWHDVTSLQATASCRGLFLGPRTDRVTRPPKSAHPSPAKGQDTGAGMIL